MCLFLWIGGWLGKVLWNIAWKRRTSKQHKYGRYYRFRLHKKAFQRACEDFEIKDLGEYQELILKSTILLSADLSENFRKMYLKIYELDPVKLASAPGLACQATLKKTEVKLEL